MFDIGFQELLLVAIVALLVLGPERLPGALRTLGLWMGRMRRSFNAVKNEIEREIGMDEIRRQLHNEAVVEELKRIERDVRSTTDAAAGRSTRPPAPGPVPEQATELEMGAPLQGHGTDDPTARTQPDDGLDRAGNPPPAKGPEAAPAGDDDARAPARTGAAPHG